MGRGGQDPLVLQAKEAQASVLGPTYQRLIDAVSQGEIVAQPGV